MPLYDEIHNHQKKVRKFYLKPEYWEYLPLMFQYSKKSDTRNNVCSELSQVDKNCCCGGIAG